jgi:hypothetical protein
MFIFLMTILHGRQPEPILAPTGNRAEQRKLLLLHCNSQTENPALASLEQGIALAELTPQATGTLYPILLT